MKLSITFLTLVAAALVSCLSKDPKPTGPTVEKFVPIRSRDISSRYARRAALSSALLATRQVPANETETLPTDLPDLPEEEREGDLDADDLAFLAQFKDLDESDAEKELILLSDGQEGTFDYLLRRGLSASTAGAPQKRGGVPSLIAALIRILWNKLPKPLFLTRLFNAFSKADRVAIALWCRAVKKAGALTKAQKKYFIDLIRPKVQSITLGAIGRFAARLILEYLLLDDEFINSIISFFATSEYLDIFILGKGHPRSRGQRFLDEIGHTRMEDMGILRLDGKRFW
ncbi:hypothetical protein DFH27DRAFT_545726 [Peziza echinospora]|nr:hypothetical protein DFH27DRAFT_545726 [Peziza echinospora]